MGKLYQDSEVRYTLEEVNTGWIPKNTRVRQCCVLPPTLFNIYIEELTVRIRMSGKGGQIEDRRFGK